MSRRVVLLIALISLAVLGTAASPWTLPGGGLSAELTQHVKDRYGLDLTVRGRSTFAVLPIPRVKFENVTLEFPNQAIRADGGTLRGELRLLPLLLGRIELSDFDLTETRITGSARALRSIKWTEALKDRASGTYARRLIINKSTLRWTDLKDANLDQLNLVIRWADAAEPMTMVGSALWRDEEISLEESSVFPELLASDRISPFALTLASQSVRIAAEGEAQLGDTPRITGESTIQAKSVRDFTRWSGVDLPFGSLVRAVSVAGDFSMDRRRLSWPAVSVTMGEDKLEGTLGVRFDTDRPVITGTLAADTLNLSDLFAPFSQARTSSGSWSEETIDLTRATGADLDLRLSAATASLGRLSLEDMAASVLVQSGRIEASIGRAGFNDGSLKGRLSLVKQNGQVEFKSQGTFAGVKIAPFLAAMGEPRWITGHATGQFSFEGLGKNPADVIREAQGRSSIEVSDGEIVGIALDDALRRVEKRPLLASLNWKGGRTPFDKVQAQILVKDGVGEIAEAHLRGPAVQADLTGQVLLVDRQLRVTANVSPAGAPVGQSPALVFNVVGDWDNVAVSPEIRSLIERSGAAKPLFPSERIPANEPRPQATAQ
ncbi:AsmA family protein [Microvirga terrae]|uniref:AsmA family protein n=1 Tax=Microvirga terrae TaxID=2740529 RepID=A0ABY5RL84_9HYPH|nr:MULTISPECIES: AsmA-like C-terminal region-containing protein [Microvirga]MBQ0823786.1 AsmA family protein [Microvirga sp. HBU67558]UVF17995.1 AsmA family protein [Microvirga terrae]